MRIRRNAFYVHWTGVRGGLVWHSLWSLFRPFRRFFVSLKCQIHCWARVFQSRGTRTTVRGTGLTCLGWVAARNRSSFPCWPPRRRHRSRWLCQGRLRARWNVRLLPGCFLRGVRRAVVPHRRRRHCAVAHHPRLVITSSDLDNRLESLLRWQALSL